MMIEEFCDGGVGWGGVGMEWGRDGVGLIIHNDSDDRSSYCWSVNYCGGCPAACSLTSGRVILCKISSPVQVRQYCKL